MASAKGGTPVASLAVATTSTSGTRASKSLLPAFLTPPLIRKRKHLHDAAFSTSLPPTSTASPVKSSTKSPGFLSFLKVSPFHFPPSLPPPPSFYRVSIPAPVTLRVSMSRNWRRSCRIPMMALFQLSLCFFSFFFSSGSNFELAILQDCCLPRSCRIVDHWFCSLVLLPSRWSRSCRIFKTFFRVLFLNMRSCGIVFFFV